MVSPKKLESIIGLCVLAIYVLLVYHADLICHVQMLCGLREVHT